VPFLRVGGKDGRFMKGKTKYTDEPMGELKIVKNFLPPPDQLVLKEDSVKVTISLKKSSIDFFKQQAKKHRTSYQKMIREVVDWYASHYQKSA
jgi:predicted DNA binding CopG/RHH family protein